MVFGPYDFFNCESCYYMLVYLASTNNISCYVSFISMCLFKTKHIQLGQFGKTNPTHSGSAIIKTNREK